MWHNGYPTKRERENHRLKSFKSAKNRRRFESLKREFSYEDEVIFSKPHRIHWTAIFTILTNLPLKNSTIHVNQYIYIYIYIAKTVDSQRIYSFFWSGNPFSRLHAHRNPRSFLRSCELWCLMCICSHCCAGTWLQLLHCICSVLDTRIFILFLECKNDNGKSSQSHFSLPGKLTI